MNTTSLIGYMINTTVNVGETAYSGNLEFCDSRADAQTRMRHWAAWHDAIDNLSNDGEYFYKSDMGGNLTHFRLEPVWGQGDGN